MEANFITAVFLPLALGIIMLGMGMSLRLADFKRVVTEPKAATLGLLNQLVALPLIAFAIAALVPMSPELAMGIIILAVCPGGPTSNLITYLCRADVALSITLTAVSSLVTVITIPLLVNLSLGFFMGAEGPARLPLLDSAAKILVITLVPTAIGMVLNARFPALCRRLSGAVGVASIGVFTLVLGGAIASQWSQLPAFFRQAGLAVVLLNVATMAVGFFSARLASIRRDQALTVSIESGLQNGTLAITIAASPLLLNNPTMAIAPAIYSLVMFVSAAALVIATRVRRA